MKAQHKNEKVASKRVKEGWYSVQEEGKDDVIYQSYKVSRKMKL